MLVFRPPKAPTLWKSKQTNKQNGTPLFTFFCATGPPVVAGTRRLFGATKTPLCLQVLPEETLAAFPALFSLRAKLFCNRAPAKTALFSLKRPRSAASRRKKRRARPPRRKRRKTVVLCYSFLRTVQGSVRTHLNGTGAGPPGRANARRGSKP